MSIDQAIRENPYSNIFIEISVNLSQKVDRIISKLNPSVLEQLYNNHFLKFKYNGSVVYSRVPLELKEELEKRGIKFNVLNERQCGQYLRELLHSFESFYENRDYNNDR